MFRIHFDPKLGRFIVQVKTGLFWRTTMCLADGSDKTDKCLYKTYDEAMDHVKSVGLDKLYRDGSRNRFDSFLNGSMEPHHA